MALKHEERFLFPCSTEQAGLKRVQPNDDNRPVLLCIIHREDSSHVFTIPLSELPIMVEHKIKDNQSFKNADKTLCCQYFPTEAQRRAATEASYRQTHHFHSSFAYFNFVNPGRKNQERRRLHIHFTALSPNTR